MTFKDGRIFNEEVFKKKKNSTGNQLPTNVSWLHEIIPAFVVASHKSILTTICIPLLLEWQLGWLSQLTEYGCYFPFGKFANTEQTDSSNTWQAHS